VQILVVMVLLMRIIHVFPALAGLTVTIILVPITTVVSRRLRKVRAALIKCTDDRVKLVTEVITGRPHTQFFFQFFNFSECVLLIIGSK